MTQGKFRWKTILLLAVSSIMLGAGWYFLHKYQMRSLQPRLLEQATRAEYGEHPHYDRAETFLRQYLKLNRDDVDVQARYGVLLEEKLHQNPRIVLGIYEEVLRQDEKRQDIRKRAAKLYLYSSKFAQALEHLATLKKADPADAEILVLEGICLRKGALLKEPGKEVEELAKAKDCFEQAIKQDSHYLDAYRLLARLCLDEKGLNNPAKAVQVLDALVGANPQNPDAYRVRAAYRRIKEIGKYNCSLAFDTTVFGWSGSPLGRMQLFAALPLVVSLNLPYLSGASQDLAEARKLAPDDAEVLLASAQLESLLALEDRQANPDNPHLSMARAYLERAAQLHPKDQRILPELVKLQRNAGQQNKALETLRVALDKAPGSARDGLLWEMAELLIDTNDLEEAGRIINQMEKNGYQKHRLDYLRGNMAFNEGKWREAAEKYLEPARPVLATDTPGLIKRTDFLLGKCYEQLDNPDQALAVYQRARKWDPLDPEPRISLINMLSALGRLEEAVEECESLKRLPDPRHRTDIPLLYARVLYWWNIRTSAQRRWAEVTAVLKALSSENPKRLEVELLRVDVKAAQGEFGEAKKILQDYKAYEPQAVEPWIALAALAARDNHVSDALRLLEDAEAKFKDVPEIRLAKLHYVPPAKEEALAFLGPLADGLEKIKPAMRARLRAELAEAYERAGALPEAEKLWTGITKEESSLLPLRVRVFEFYLRTGNQAGMEKALSAISDIEGAEGPFALFVKAQLFIFRAGQESANRAELLESARRLLLSAAAKRPRWPRIPEALASIAALRENGDQVISYWRQAVDLGSFDVSVILGLLTKYKETNQLTEANALVSKFQGMAPISASLLKMEADLSIRNQDIARALSLTKTVSVDSKDYRDFLWKGQIQLQGALLTKEQGTKKNALLQEAKASFARATELAAAAPEGWVAWFALVQFHVFTKSMDPGWRAKAQAAIESMKAKVPASKLPFALAKTYEVINDRVKAEEAYQEALRLLPDNLGLLQNVVRFHLAYGGADKAERDLRRMLAILDGQDKKDSEDMLIWVRRYLATSIALQSNGAKQSQALKLIDENLALKPSSIEDLIIKARLLGLTADGRPQAITILEKAFKVRTPSAEEMATLASLYEMQRDWPKARSYMQELLSAHAKDEKYPEYLAAFIVKLLSYDDLNAAEVWLPRLRELHTHAFFEVECVVRYNAKRGDKKTILGPIKTYLESKESIPADPAVRLMAAARLLGDLTRQHSELMKSLIQDSDTMLKSFASRTGKKDSLLAVASFLASAQRLDECLDICEKALRDVPVLQVVQIAAAAVGVTTVPTPKQIERVVTWVNLGQKKLPDSVDWDNLLATLRERQENYAEAERLYRKVLEREPLNLIANNNLAYLLGLLGKGAEANDPMHKAIDAMGDLNAEVLDTRAVVLRSQGKLKEAEKEINVALRMQKTATRLFHLAQVHQSAHNMKKAIEVFGEARRLGLQSEMLHPLERPSFQELLREHKLTQLN